MNTIFPSLFIEGVHLETALSPAAAGSWSTAPVSSEGHQGRAEFATALSYTGRIEVTLVLSTYAERYTLRLSPAQAQVRNPSNYPVEKRNVTHAH